MQRGRHTPLASDPFGDFSTAKLIDLKRSIDDRIAERRSVGGSNTWGRNEGRQKGDLRMSLPPRNSQDVFPPLELNFTFVIVA